MGGGVAAKVKAKVKTTILYMVFFIFIARGIVYHKTTAFGKHNRYFEFALRVKKVVQCDLGLNIVEVGVVDEAVGGNHRHVNGFFCTGFA